MAISMDAEPGASWHAPETVEEAVRLLAELGDEAKVLAGGQSLLVLKRMGLVSPTAFVSLDRIPALTAISATGGGGLAIGAMVTQSVLEQSAEVRQRATALAEAAENVASLPVRRRGTIGGNLCHADPTGDPAAALIALGATVHIVGPSGARTVPVADLFTDFMETCLEPGEVLVSVELPAREKRSGSAYRKHRLRGTDTALVGVAASVSLDAAGLCSSLQLGIVGAAPTPFLASGAGALAAGNRLDEATIAACARQAAEEADPLSDTEGSDWYRREMVEVFARRAIEAAQGRAAQG